MRFIKKVLCFFGFLININVLSVDQNYYNDVVYNSLFEKGLWCPNMIILGIIARIKQCLPQQPYGPYQAYLPPEQQVINNCQPSKNPSSFSFSTNKPPCCSQDTSTPSTSSYAQESLERTLANARGAFTHPFFNQQQPYISPAKLAMQEMAIMICQRYDLTFDQACQVLRCYCSQYFGVSSSQLNELCACNDYEYVASTIVSDGHLSQEQSENVWNFYCKYQNFYRNKKINHGLTRIKEKYRRIAKQKQQEAEKKQEALLHQQFLQETYATFLDLPDDIKSSYHQARLQAYEKTVQQRYASLKDYCDLDLQTIGLCVANNIDYQVLQRHCATPLQHQLYQEVVDCYKKNARLAMQATYTESSLVQQSLNFAQLSMQAIGLEVINLACICNDVAHTFANTLGTIVEGIYETGQEFIVNPPSPLDPLEDAIYGIGYIINFVIEGGYCVIEIASRSENPEHCNATAQQAVACWTELKHWYKNSSGQGNVKIATKFVTNLLLRRKFFGLLSQATITCRNFIDIAKAAQGVECFETVKSQNIKFLTEALKNYNSIGIKQDPLPINNLSQMGHIFNPKKLGHVADNLKNREALRNLINVKNYLGQDLVGRHWFSRQTQDGKQWWAWVKNGIIRSGGLNETPIAWNKKTGLCKLLTDKDT